MTDDDRDPGYVSPDEYERNPEFYDLLASYSRERVASNDRRRL